MKRKSSIDDQMSIYNSVIKCWNKRVNNTGDLGKNQRAIFFVFKIYIHSEKESFFKKKQKNTHNIIIFVRHFLSLAVEVEFEL